MRKLTASVIVLSLAVLAFATQGVVVSTMGGSTFTAKIKAALATAEAKGWPAVFCDLSGALTETIVVPAGVNLYGDGNRIVMAAGVKIILQSGSQLRSLALVGAGSIAAPAGTAGQKIMGVEAPDAILEYDGAGMTVTASSIGGLTMTASSVGLIVTASRVTLPIAMAGSCHVVTGNILGAAVEVDPSSSGSCVVTGNAVMK